MKDKAVRLAKYSELPNMNNYYTKEEIDKIIEESAPKEPILSGTLAEGNTVTFDNKRWVVVLTKQGNNEAYLALSGGLGYSDGPFKTIGANSDLTALNNSYMKYRLQEYQSKLSEDALNIIIPKKYYRSYDNLYDFIEGISEDPLGTFSCTNRDQIYLSDNLLGNIPTALKNTLSNSIWLGTIRYTPNGKYGIHNYHYKTEQILVDYEYSELGNMNADTVPVCCIPLDTPSA